MPSPGRRLAQVAAVGLVRWGLRSSRVTRPVSTVGLVRGVLNLARPRLAFGPQCAAVAYRQSAADEDNVVMLFRSTLKTMKFQGLREWRNSTARRRDRSHCPVNR